MKYKAPRDIQSTTFPGPEQMSGRLMIIYRGEGGFRRNVL